MFKLTSPRLSSRSVSVIPLAIAVPGVFELLSVAATQSECGQTLGGNGAVSGSWTGDCLSESIPTGPTDPLPGTRYARFYSFSLTEQSDVTITLESETNPYLFLLDGDGEAVAENDDIDTSGSNYNSRIEMMLDLGDFTIEATTYSREATGEFTLTAAGIDFGASEPTPEARPTSTPVPATQTSTPTPEPTPPSERDRAALVALYNSTVGANWSRKDNWLSNRPLGEWDGVITRI
ncbi:MAG: PPC domain-containing protein [Chloroflexi bacterium]|nr:PPC domain-containing protein [Chloroflexota bacterium]